METATALRLLVLLPCMAALIDTRSKRDQFRIIRGENATQEGWSAPCCFPLSLANRRRKHGQPAR